MNRIVQALQEVDVFYLATVENGEPKVRPLGAVMEWEGKAYLCTGNKKAMYRQMVAHPQVQLCGAKPDGTWVRVDAKVVEDDRKEAREAMLEAVPILKGMYRADDGVFTVFYLEDAKAYACTMTGEATPL